MDTATGTVAALVWMTVLAGGCVPKVSMIIETRTPQGAVIQRGTVTNSDTADHPFTIDAGGSIFVTAAADDSNGLASLYVTGGNSCGRAGQSQQGLFTGTNPNLSGQHPTSSSFTATFPLQCGGGTFTGSMMACASNAKQSRSCTPNATFK